MFSWFHWVVYLCSLAAHQDSSMQFVRQFISLYFFVVIYWKNNVVLLWSHGSLKSDIDVYGFVLMNGFGRKIPSLVNPPRYSEAFSDFFYWCACFTLFFPIVDAGWEFLRLYAFFKSCKARTGTLSFLFTFPWAIFRNVPVCEPSPNPQPGWLSALAC